MFFFFMNKKVNEQQICTICTLCEHTHTSEREPYIPQVVGVSIPILSERKPYLPYVVGVGSPIPFQEAESFSYMHYVMSVATSTLFGTSM